MPWETRSSDISDRHYLYCLLACSFCIRLSIITMIPSILGIPKVSTCCCLSRVSALFPRSFFFFAKATLTSDAIEHVMWPLFWRYPLAQFSEIERNSFIQVRFSDARRFSVLPFTSGQTYFLEQLDALTRRSSKGPSASGRPQS